MLAEGDERGKGQIMADLLIERLTGQATAEGVGVNLDVIISDKTLLAGGTEPATIPGWGPVPAQMARDIIANATHAALSDQAVSWIRSLYADPTGRLVAMSTRQRFVTSALADLLRIRDQGLCRTPFCDAPIRHHDHITPAAAGGGETTEANTQGLCITCNLTKQADGWTHRVVDDLTGRHTVETITPTGHRHRSRAPAPPTPARQHSPRPIIVELHRPDLAVDLADNYAAA